MTFTNEANFLASLRAGGLVVIGNSACVSDPRRSKDRVSNASGIPLAGGIAGYRSSSAAGITSACLSACKPSRTMPPTHRPIRKADGPSDPRHPQKMAIHSDRASMTRTDRSARAPADSHCHIRPQLWLAIRLFKGLECAR